MLSSSTLGRGLMLLGLTLFLVGLAIELGRRYHLLGWLSKLGQLPGDFNIEGEGWQFHAPIATSLLISLLVTLCLWLFTYFQGSK